MLNLGFLYLEQRRPENALSTFLQIRHEYPDDRDPLVPLQIAAILRTLKRADEALAAVETGLGLLPDNPRLVAEKAQILAAAGRPDEGVALLQDRLSADRDDDIPLYLGLAAVHAEGRRWDDAIHALETALSRHEGDIQLMFQHAAVLERAGRYGPAADAFRRLLAADPDNATAMNYLGYMLIDYNLDVTAGIAHVQQAKREPKTPPTWTAWAGGTQAEGVPQSAGSAAASRPGAAHRSHALGTSRRHLSGAGPHPRRPRLLRESPVLLAGSGRARPAQ